MPALDWIIDSGTPIGTRSQSGPPPPSSAPHATRRLGLESRVPLHPGPRSLKKSAIGTRARPRGPRGIHRISVDHPSPPDERRHNPYEQEHSMEHTMQFYIDGEWVEPAEAQTLDVINPADRRADRHASALGTADGRRPAVARRAPRLRDVLADDARGAPRAARARSSRCTRRTTTRSPRPSRRRWARRCGSRNAAQAAAGLGALHRDASRCSRRYEFEELQGTTLIRARADRRVRPDHAVELAGQPDRLQGRAGARGRLHDGAEAERDRAAHRDPLRARSCTRPACRPASSTWSTATARRSARRSRRIPASTWCRSPARRAPASRSRKAARRHGQARHAGARRQVGQHHPRRRRPRTRRSAAA